MPWRPIKEQDGMGSPGHGARNLVDVQLHTVRANKRECETCGLAKCGTDCPEQPGVGIALVGWLAWPGSSFGPLTDDTILLPDPRFVLEPNFDPFVARQMAGVGIQDCREVFLNASMMDVSCLGWRGRALT
ncbi:hypothetical protein HK11_08945 [Acetobacter sp. DmW_043]|nr:hypothetical protein HK11_08945 [Acetobacter sp. DmW_043]